MANLVSASSLPSSSILSPTPCVYRSSCHARVGFLGNPSDGFNGKTLSFLLGAYRAEVSISVSECKGEEKGGIELFESVKSKNLGSLHNHTVTYGYQSGLKLIQATCKVFQELCESKNIPTATSSNINMIITYNTNIPRMVGLSGSSAIVVACFRSLMKAFNVDSISALGIEESYFPQIILDIERLELGISAGLQDRVVQTYGGCMHMDFSKTIHTENVYTRVDPSLLPNMYISYDLNAGGDSGGVHSTVKERWAAREPALLQGMGELATLADEALQCLLNRRRKDEVENTTTSATTNTAHSATTNGESNLKQLAALMEKNFATRRRLYGDAVVGNKNIQVAELLGSCGLAAKFTGSGGAFVCLRSDGKDEWLSAEKEKDVSERLATVGFCFERITRAEVDEATVIL